MTRHHPASAKGAWSQHLLLQLQAGAGAGAAGGAGGVGVGGCYVG